MAHGRVDGQVKEFRKKFESAGVLIEIVKWDGIFAHVRRRGRLLLPGLEGARRARALERDLAIGRARNASASSPTSTRCRSATTATPPRPPRTGSRRFRYAKYNARQSRPRPLHGGHRDLADPVPEEAPRSDHAHPRQGRKSEQRRERAVRRGRHADQGSAAAPPRQQVERFRPRSSSSTRCPPARIAWRRWPSASSSARTAWCKRHRGASRQRSRQLASSRRRTWTASPGTGLARCRSTAGACSCSSRTARARCRCR